MAAEGGHDDEGDLAVARPRLLHELDAVEARHLQVGEDDVGRELLELAERLEAVGGGLDRVALVAQELGERRTRVGLVVDDEDAAALHFGGKERARGDGSAQLRTGD